MWAILGNPHVTDLARFTVRATIGRPINDKAATDSDTVVDEEERSVALPDAMMPLADCSGGRVVCKQHGQSDEFAQLSCERIAAPFR